MTNGRSSLLVGGVGALLLCAGFGARAQDAAPPADTSNTSSSTVIGHPQLKDFSLTPTQRIVTQPAPAQAAPPAELAPPPPVANQPGAAAAPAPSAAAAPGPVSRSREAARQTTHPELSAPTPPTGVAGPSFGAPPTDLPAAAPEAPAAVSVADRDGATPYWYYALPAAALALLGLAAVRRRRRNGATEPLEETVPVAAAPPTPRPDPIPRPWLELSLKAERASFTATEAVVLFELEISNTGGSAARNLRIDVKMLNAGVEQDKEIGAFFKTAGRESTKLSLPVVEAGVTGVIKGQVKMPVEEMRAVRLDERLLFIPVIAVNALYDRGAGRTGQTSRSYVVGRELQEASEKMGAFRVDQGPRVWRTVGQRAHKLAKRV
jgi:MYXO-CTERM domain-containing protein